MICCAVHAALGNSVMLKWTTRRRSRRKTKKTSRTRKVAVGTAKKSIEASAPRWLSKKVRHVCEGGSPVFFLGMKRETLRSLTWKPSWSNSPWIFGASQPTLDSAIWRISFLISGVTSPFFDLRGRDFQRQKRRNPRRCQRTTVSGFTMTSTSVKRDQMRESRSQKARSRLRRCGRLELRCNTASCWRRARFSMTRSACGRKPARSARRVLRMRARIASIMHEAKDRYPRHGWPIGSCHRRVSSFSDEHLASHRVIAALGRQARAKDGDFGLGGAQALGCLSADVGREGGEVVGRGGAGWSTRTGSLVQGGWIKSSGDG